MGAPVVMIGCYVCMFFLAFSPGSGNTRSKAARIERTESSNSFEGRASYWDSQLGDVEVYLRKYEDGIRVEMKDGSVEEAIENPDGTYQGYHSGRIYRRK